MSKLLTAIVLHVHAALMQTLEEEIYIVQSRPQPRCTGGRENNFSFMRSERRKSALTSSPTGLLPLPVLASSTPSPTHPLIAVCARASRGFSLQPLLRSSAHLVSSPPSVSPRCHSRPTVTPWLPSPLLRPHCLYCSDSCHCDSCSVCVCMCVRVLGCCVRKGSLLPCCSVYVCMCVHAGSRRRASSGPECQSDRLSDPHKHAFV